jgi:hypothetical protein
VRDQTSCRPVPPGTLPPDTPTDSPTASLAGALRCMVCGRQSGWLLPPRWPVRRVSPEVSPDHARTTRGNSPPLFRRALASRHHRRGPRRPP